MSHPDETGPVTPDDMMRYLDGEMTPRERERVDLELETSTELQREVAVFQNLKSEMQGLQLHPAAYSVSVWDRVNMRLNRRLGWLFFVVGLGLWMGYGTWVFSTSSISPWEKLGTGAVAIGVLMLLTSVVWERYREWETDPYKDVKR